MNKVSTVWYLIPSDLMQDVTERLDTAGVSFHVTDREELAEAISKFIISFEDKEVMKC